MDDESVSMPVYLSLLADRDRQKARGDEFREALRQQDLMLTRMRSQMLIYRAALKEILVSDCPKDVARATLGEER